MKRKIDRTKSIWIIELLNKDTTDRYKYISYVQKSRQNHDQKTEICKTEFPEIKNIVYEENMWDSV